MDEIDTRPEAVEALLRDAEMLADRIDLLQESQILRSHAARTLRGLARALSARSPAPADAAREAALREAVRVVTGIRKDLADFDGDRRGHVAALHHAEDVLAELAVMVFCPDCGGRGYLTAGERPGADILHCCGCDAPRGRDPDIRRDAARLLDRVALAHPTEAR